jgi:multidrug resistance efflux pump
VGSILLLASLGIAAVSIRSQSGDGSTSVPPTQTSGGEQSWMATGHVDVEGGVTPLYPVSLGRVTSIEAKENEMVEAHAPLFHLDDAMAQFQVQEAEFAVRGAKEQLVQAQSLVAQHKAKIEAQKAAIKAAEADAKLAEIARDRIKRINNSEINYARDLAAAETLLRKAQAGVEGENAKLNGLEVMKPDSAVRLAQNNVDAKQVLVRKAQKGVQECVVRAPVRGTPLRVLVGIGQTLGSNPRQPAIQFCPDRPLIVRAEVEQEFASRVQNDQPVVIQDHITGKECGQGKVASISRWYTHRRSILQDALQFNDVRTLECIIKLDGGSQDLRIGQRVRVRFSDSGK